MKDHLENHLQIISKILLHANSSFDVVRFFDNESDNDEPIIKSEKVMNKFFHFATVNFYRIVVIELCKLYNHQEEFSFKKLFFEFENGRSYYGFLDNNKIKSLRKHLNKNNAIIKELIELRNSHYAHQDKNYQNYLGLESEKIQKLLDDAKIIFNTIYGEVFQKSFYFDFPLGTPMNDLEFIIERMKYYDDNYRLMEENVIKFIQ